MGFERQLSTVAATDLVRVHSGGADYDAAAQLVANLAITQLGTTLATVPTAAAGAPLNAQLLTTYTLALTDAGRLVTLSNSGAITLTVPPNSSVAFPVGAVVVIAQLGAGLVTVAAGAGVTVSQVAGTLKLLGQYSVATLRKVAVNTWLLNGDVSAT